VPPATSEGKYSSANKMWPIRLTRQMRPMRSMRLDEADEVNMQPMRLMAMSSIAIKIMYRLLLKLLLLLPFSLKIPRSSWK
jgi:hypothetical protein